MVKSVLLRWTPSFSDCIKLKGHYTDVTSGSGISVGHSLKPHSLSLKQILVLLSLHIRTRISCYCPFRLQKDQNSWYRGVVWQFLQQNTTQYDNIPPSNASPRPLFENLTDDAIA